MSELEINELVIIEYTEEQDGNDLYSDGQFPAPAVNLLWQRQLILWKPLLLDVNVDKGDETDGSVDHGRKVCKQSSLPVGGYSFADMPELTNGRRVEEHQTEGDYQIDANHLPYVLLFGPSMGIDLDFPFLEETASYHQGYVPQTMVDAEEEEGPIGPMPESYKRHVQHDSEDGAVDTPVPELDVQWQEHIVCQPIGQRHVPSAPITGNVEHEEGPLEVL